MNPSILSVETISQATMQSPELTRAYLYFLDITVVVSLPVHFLILGFALFHTPLEMFCYKMTVSNTTFWSTLVLIWMCIILRPVILFPYPVAISFGPRSWISTYSDAQFHFNVLILLTINMLTAMIICFTSLCLYLIQSPVLDILGRKSAIVLAGLIHTTSTIFGYVLFNVLYNVNDQLRSVIMEGRMTKNNNSTDYSKLIETVRQTDGIVFGYVPNANLSLVSFLTWTFFTATVVIVLICLTLVMRELFRAINKTRSWRFKRNVFFMLASRTTVPLIFGFIPTIALTYMIWMDTQSLMLVGNALFAVANSQAMINCIATICVFRPYRRTFMRIFSRCFPEDMRHRLYQSTTTFATKGNLTTVSHWSKHVTSAHFNSRVAPFQPAPSRRNATFEQQRIDNSVYFPNQ